MPPPESTQQEPDFIRRQRAFARHLRDPASVEAPPSLEDRRVAIYRNTVYANVEGLMADNYPRIRGVMSDNDWHAMIRDYIVRHRSDASAFVDVPKEFLIYLEDERNAPADPPFLCELAHFDWLETRVGADPCKLQKELQRLDRDGDLLSGVLVLNPTLQLVTYRFSVHVVDADFQPLRAPTKATRIAAFRAPDNLYAFLDLNDAAAKLLQVLLDGHARSGRALLSIAMQQLAGHSEAKLLEAGQAILERMRTRGAILGVRRV